MYSVGKDGVVWKDLADGPLSTYIYAVGLLYQEATSGATGSGCFDAFLQGSPSYEECFF